MAKIHSGVTRGNDDLELVLRGILTDLEALRSPLGGMLSGSKTFDPSSLADGAGEETTVTVTGAALGDFVVGVSHSVDTDGIILYGWVSAADTVTVRLQNESGGTLDIGSGTLRVRVLPQSSFDAPDALVTS